MDFIAVALQHPHRFRNRACASVQARPQPVASGPPPSLDILDSSKSDPSLSPKSFNSSKISSIPLPAWRGGESNYISSDLVRRRSGGSSAWAWAKRSGKRIAGRGNVPISAVGAGAASPRSSLRSRTPTTRKKSSAGWRALSEFWRAWLFFPSAPSQPSPSSTHSSSAPRGKAFPSGNNSGARTPFSTSPSASF